MLISNYHIISILILILNTSVISVYFRWESVAEKMLVNAYIVLSYNFNLNFKFEQLGDFCVFQDGVRGGEDADELVHVPAVQVPA